jgi:hypothetical protein
MASPSADTLSPYAGVPSPSLNRGLLTGGLSWSPSRRSSWRLARQEESVNGSAVVIRRQHREHSHQSQGTGEFDPQETVVPGVLQAKAVLRVTCQTSRVGLSQHRFPRCESAYGQAVPGSNPSRRTTSDSQVPAGILTDHSNWTGSAPCGVAVQRSDAEPGVDLSVQAKD